MTKFTCTELWVMNLESGLEKTLLDELLSTVNPLQEQQLPFTWLQQDAPPAAGSYMRPQNNEEWRGYQDNSAEILLKPA